MSDLEFPTNCRIAVYGPRHVSSRLRSVSAVLLDTEMSFYVRDGLRGVWPVVAIDRQPGVEVALVQGILQGRHRVAGVADPEHTVEVVDARGLDRDAHLAAADGAVEGGG